MARRWLLALCVFAACLVWVGTRVGSREDEPHAFDVRLVRAPETAVAPLSLTASDGTGLQLRELTAKIVLEPPLAFTEVELAFRNPEPRRLEGRFEITLPEAASISRLALQMGDRFQEGEIVERHRAQLAYEEALHGRRDPALLERDAGNQYGVRVFPIEAHELKRVIVAYSQVIGGDEDAYRLHLAGLPPVDKVRLEISRAGAKEKTRVFERRDWRPNGDVAVSVPEPAGSSALVHGHLALVQVRPATQSSPTALQRLTVLFDTSASRAADFAAQSERMQAIVKELGAQHGSAIPIQLVVFDQETVPLLEARSDALGADLTAQLLARGALGATDLEAALHTLATLPELGDRVLIFTDGVASAGATGAGAIARAATALSARGVQRIDVVTQGAVLDRASLDALVHAELPEAGVVASDRDAVATAQRLLRGTERRVEVEIEGAAWTFPSVLAGVEPGVAYPIFVRLGDAEAKTLRLRVGSENVPLTTARASLEALLDHEWARARIAHLQGRMTELSDADAERARTQIVELSREHRVLSDHTALVVLENDSDYARNGIARSALSDVTVVRDGALAAATEPQAARDPLMDDGRVRAARGIGQGAGDGTIGLGGLGTIGMGRGGGADTAGIIGVLRGGVGDGAVYGQGPSRFAGIAADTPYGRVRAGKPDVRGNLSNEVVRRVVQRHLTEARFCYEQRLNDHRRLAGDMFVRFVISATGAVMRAVNASSGMHDKALDQCMEAAVRRWLFPAPEGGGIAVVSQSFHFSIDHSTPRPPPSPRLQRRLQTESFFSAQRAQQREKAKTAAQARRDREWAWARRAQPKPAQYLQGPMLEALELLELGDTDEAFENARAWQRKSPHDVMALLALARTAESIGERTLAARAYGSLIDLFPSRPDMRRTAGEGLEGLGDAALHLAIDSYRKAVELRPDHPSSHRLLGMALWRSGAVEQAHAAFARASTTNFPIARFPGVQPLFGEEAELTSNALRQPQALLRVCVYWETDATNLDLHVYDGEHRHAAGEQQRLDNGAGLSADVTTGYGPECFTARGSEIAYPYLLQGQYVARGAMGHALGAVHILRISAQGEASFESRPFIVMRDGAFVSLGELAETES